MKIKLKEISPEKKVTEKEIYLDGILKSNLDLGMKQLRRDWDQVWFIDGPEGAGKSVLAATLAYYVSPEERRHDLLDRIIIKIEDAPTVIKAAKPFDGVVIDESFGGMSSAGFMNKLNKMLQRMFTEIRAKNLFIFIVAPTFMDINKYFAIWRSKCLLHVYSTKGERGYCSFFSADRKKKLYIIGKKKFYDYQCVFPNFRFRFTNCADKFMDWDAYKAKKAAKNLEIEEESFSHQSIEKLVREEGIKNNKKLDKPLLQRELAVLFGCSVGSIKNYERDVRVDKVYGENILSNLNPKITPTNEEDLSAQQESSSVIEEEDLSAQLDGEEDE